MARPGVSLLSSDEIRAIHETSLRVLAEVGVVVPHEEVLDSLAQAGAIIDRSNNHVFLPEEIVLRAVEIAGKQYVLHGRESGKVARYGHGDSNLMSSPGQFAWFDHGIGARREPTMADARAAITIGDALPNVSVVGALAVPVDAAREIRDVLLTAELIRGTGKPTRCWPVTRQSTTYVLELYKAVAGGADELRARPMIETFLEPISPLRFPTTGLDVMIAFLEHGQPVSIGPMVMASGTGPATLAGTLAQEHAEILAGITIVQTLAPGTPVMYGGIPHILDPRTSICAFGSPEQGLMAVAMAQLGQSCGFPVYVNVNLTDSKLLDVQAGMEKMGSFMLGMLAGADQFGHGGIVGTDHGGSLEWLVIDDEAVSYARRVARGFAVDDEALALDVIAGVGAGGDFLAEDHTVEHFRKEFFLPGPRWTRETYAAWRSGGGTSMGDRAHAHVQAILAGHRVAPLDTALDRELDRIVEAARKDLVD